MPTSANQRRIEELLKRREMRKYSAIEVVGENVAKPPPKRRMKMSKDGKCLEIEIVEDTE